MFPQRNRRNNRGVVEQGKEAGRSLSPPPVVVRPERNRNGRKRTKTPEKDRSYSPPPVRVRPERNRNGKIRSKTPDSDRSYSPPPVAVRPERNRNGRIRTKTPEREDPTVSVLPERNRNGVIRVPESKESKVKTPERNRNRTPTKSDCGVEKAQQTSAPISSRGRGEKRTPPRVQHGIPQRNRSSQSTEMISETYSDNTHRMEELQIQPQRPTLDTHRVEPPQRNRGPAIPTVQQPAEEVYSDNYHRHKEEKLKSSQYNRIRTHSKRNRSKTGNRKQEDEIVEEVYSDNTHRLQAVQLPAEPKQHKRVVNPPERNRSGIYREETCKEQSQEIVYSDNQHRFTQEQKPPSRNDAKQHRRVVNPPERNRSGIYKDEKHKEHSQVVYSDNQHRFTQEQKSPGRSRATDQTTPPREVVYSDNCHR